MSTQPIPTTSANPFEELRPCSANYVPLSPLSFLRKAAEVYPDRAAIIHGELRRTWSETYVAGVWLRRCGDAGYHAEIRSQSWRRTSPPCARPTSACLWRARF
jgi:hypothetical protein